RRRARVRARRPGGPRGRADGRRAGRRVRPAVRGSRARGADGRGQLRTPRRAEDRLGARGRAAGRRRVVKILVANNAAPFVRGGAELLADRLINELIAAGHQAELLRIPLGNTPEEIADGLVAAATLEAVEVDRVIALKFPAYVIPHRDVVVWLIHQFR